MSRAAKGAVSLSPSRVLGALGRRRRDAVRTVRYRSASQRPLRQAVLFESFMGKVVGDSPLDICRELQSRGTGLELIWTTADPTAPVPTGTRAVVLGSAAWLDALATSRYIVNNSNNPWYFRKRPGQVYLQTWHGTPLKRLVLDIESGSVTSGYLKAFVRDSSMWDALVSPNPYCSEVLPRAFGYRGPLLETGYPRNDRLSTASDEDRRTIRARLGFGDEDRLLLYAPTWRDTRRTPTGRWAPVNLLPSDLVVPAPWTVLFRGHTNTHDAHDPSVAGRFVDVTRYPDVAELLIAADALLTDYSSVMFDFTITGKPLLLLAPDIEHYQAARGFYFDLEADVPGPVLSDPAALTGLLEELDGTRLTYADRYDAWRRRFNCWEDGHAAARVVDAVWGRGEDQT